MTAAQQATAERLAAEEAPVIAALAPLVTGSPHPAVVVAATASVLGRMLGMAHQAGVLAQPVAAEARAMEEMMRLGLHHQLGTQPAIASIAGRV